MINDGWHYDAVRARIPDDWIQDPDIPEFCPEKKPQYPPGTRQKGNIVSGAMRKDEERTFLSITTVIVLTVNVRSALRSW